ncbi:S-adenosylmethionine:tRNA ribosyltransferase-isomerase [Deminuibacter soli]|uniref:S-adenosylmethionine:tRNA ribosyltransferase-isomerase n=1 Tax=Deminuibacter soli TaxID=2291815 RepID=A0A3E1NEE0_9BACT|nr:S-adenosylmethionine:tRNA ribosyltransferase-isomerase [Deminuibacter soli]RFM26212.1 S-adenosylmethionine:tRNA ribosyltransferase-isomerase [Deminuibacter soli]
MHLHPRHISIKDFTYHLPDERIARYPLAERDASKLLVYRNGTISESNYRHLPDFIPAESLLLFNNTKVVEARLLFQKSTGSTIELFCLEPGDNYPDITTAMLQKKSVRWKCLVGGAKKWKEGALEKTITIHNHPVLVQAHKLEKSGDSFLIEFEWDDDSLSFAELLHAAGVLPLPPYLNRVAEEEDKQRYQTVYARHDGSVAAPTAGLHFTPALQQALASKQVQQQYVTLHVGAGTFKPVKSETLEAHEMHAEFMDVPLQLIEHIAHHIETIQKPVIAVGTTSLRTIESLYWLGVEVLQQPQLQPAAMHVQQWAPYQTPQAETSTVAALQALAAWMRTNALERLIVKTQIIIAPGYRLKVADALITNFHQPQSTLLLLIAAITGDNWRTIYNYAMEHDFRFLSYGDGSLLWK